MENKGVKSDIIFWKEALEDLPDSYKSWFKNEEKYLRKNVSKGDKLLDVACGDGKGLQMVGNIIGEGIGVDYEQEAVDSAIKNFEDKRNIKIILADAIDLPFDNNSFDTVICIGSFCNSGEDKLKWLIEMKRVVKEDGKIILSVYSEDAFEERMSFYKKLGLPIMEVKGTKVILDKSVIKDNFSEQFSEDELKEIFSDAKLEVIKIIKSGIGYMCILRK